MRQKTTNINSNLNFLSSRYFNLFSLKTKNKYTLKLNGFKIKINIQFCYTVPERRKPVIL